MAAPASPEPPGEPPASQPSTKQPVSFASVVQNKHVLTKYDLQISNTEGQRSVEIPDEVFVNPSPLWEDFVIGRFLFKILKFDDGFEVDMWNIADIPMVVSKWTPYTEEDIPELKPIPIWVHLKNVPMNMFSWKGLSFITSAVGEPKHLHPETAACSTFDIAKVFVNADLSKELPKTINFSKNGQESLVEFNYPWLPPRCSTCDKWGHLDTSCVINKKRVEGNKESETSVQTEEPEVAITSESPADAGDTGSGAKDKVVEKVVDVNSEQWTEVSPSKVGRSPHKPNVREVESSHISQAKFSILSSNEEEGEIVETETENLELVHITIQEQAQASQASLPSNHPELNQQARKETTDSSLRPSLPRDSKNKHRFLTETSTQANKDTPMKLGEGGRYALNTVEERKSLWADLRTHQDSPMFRNKPWLIMGDFNETLDDEEHSNSEVAPVTTSGMRDFQEIVRYCSFSDLGGHGPLFTWCNKRDEGIVCKKLDRVLMNDAWLYKYSQAYSVFEAGGCSDHLRCRVQINVQETKRKRPFKFMNSLGKMPEFLPLVGDHWSRTDTLFHSTSALFRFSKKLKAWKPGIRELSKQKFGGLSVRVNQAYQILCEKQSETHLQPTSENIRQEAEALERWQTVATLEEEFYKQKSKLHWLEEHDQGSAVPKWRESEHARSLASLFIVAIQSFFITGFLPKGLNTTILALIPKKLDASEMKDYRPISCCNIIYKVISKIIANRLKRLMPQLIAPNQSAFVKDRLLMENLLLATELVKDYHTVSISARCALKIDISKAFDSVQWPFILNTLSAMHFLPKFIHWINLCVTTASFSVQVNGELAGFFRSSRGLRQGCSLSPYLFVICMNVLSKKLDGAAQRRDIGYHPKCQNLPLTHLSFADDIMVFTDGKKRSLISTVEGVLQVFESFAKISGLRISLEKSIIFMAGVPQAERELILSDFTFAAGQLPVRYLGLPLLSKGMTRADYQPLIEKIRASISSWTVRHISYAGRLQLIRSVLMSICNFWLTAFRLPSSCIVELEKIFSAFLWSGPDLNPRKTKIAWNIVTRKKMEGGLGLRPLKESNIVSCLKLIWRVLSSSDSIWGKWIRMTLLRKESFWSVKENYSSGSWMWRKLLKLRPLASQFHKVEVRDGVGTSFWFDHWSTQGRLIELLGPRGSIDMGIPLHAGMDEVLRSHRRRRHRQIVLNRVEDELEVLKNQSTSGGDIVKWKSRTDAYKPRFSAQVWEALVKGILRDQYTTDWNRILRLANNRVFDKVTLFLLRYAIHATMYGLWRERNARRHGDTPSPPLRLIKFLDKIVRNRLSTIRSQGDKVYDEGLTIWFGTRV
ncbi:uncharacterized protein LOC112084518 [Eutrema salsugineum]|uniref:uncharacterized protein LOC112084518 n=1 Tax=Eutrema salsugineum TaxID=72664 RepID=UPI000CED09A1|nr:uncharacterized protein LOC112084518 [Eutrema salsugineum]